MYQYPNREQLITGCTFIKNEIDWIEERILEYIPYFDNIIAFDESVDGTTEVLRKYGAKVIEDKRVDTKPWHASHVRNLLANFTTTPWCWFFFPDEKLETSLSPEEVRHLIHSYYNKYNVLLISRWNEMGSEENNGWKYPDWQGNIIRNHVRYSKPYHEMPIYSEVEPVSWHALDTELIGTCHLRRHCDAIYRDKTKWERRFGDI